MAKLTPKRYRRLRKRIFSGSGKLELKKAELPSKSQLMATFQALEDIFSNGVRDNAAALVTAYGSTPSPALIKEIKMAWLEDKLQTMRGN